MASMVFKGKTAEAVLKALSAPRNPMTRAERFEQKVSYVYGVMDADSGITKEQVRAILTAADTEGVKP